MTSLAGAPVSTGLEIKSLAYKTDLAFLAEGGRVIDRGEYFFCETPDNPGFFWGNLLVMKKSPAPGDLEKWTEHFRAEFAHQPRVKHITFGWDSPDGAPGDIATFKARGFDVESSVVLTLEPSELKQPARVCDEAHVRVLESDEDWEAALQNQVACRRAEFRREVYLPFKRTQMQKYRRLAQEGKGNWFGAYLGERLVAECGLFVFDGVGRFQAVGTDPAFRRRGICGTLVNAVAEDAFSHGATVLVMVADPEYHAAKIYESVGFEPREKQIGAYKWPKADWT